MEQHNIANDGVQFMPQIAVQYVYLDFDGDLTSYNGEILSIDNVEVLDSVLTEKRITDIVRELNDKYADQNVIFVTERPQNAEYSTIYIGKTEAFAPYGNFTGVAETIDSGNKNKTDKAFVMLDSTADNAQIISTIAHETDHLLGTLDHGGEGLTAYADYYKVSSGVTSIGVALNYDYMYISSGGTANSTTVNSGGNLFISSGGTANSTTVNSDGILSISSGGTANSTTVNSGGNLFISSGGTANSTTVNSGFLFITSGGTANSTTMNGYGYLLVDSGGAANNTTVNTDGHLQIFSGGAANNTTVNSGGYLDIGSGGVANSTTVNSAGVLLIFSGGTATDIIWTPCVGVVDIDDGAYVTYTSNYSGVYFGANDQLLSHTESMSDKVLSGPGHSMYIMNGGVANSTTVNSHGRRYISSGGVANSTTVNDWSYLDISSGGVANSTTVNSDGCLYIFSGGVANSTTVNDWSYLYIFSGGVANSTTVNSDGRLYIFSGGVANSTTINSGGYLHISSGGAANNTTVNAGRLYISSGGVANSTTVSSGGAIYLYDNSTLKQSVIEGNITIHSGSYTLNNNNFSNADFTIYDGAEIDLSGNYWGITDINAIYEKYGFSYSQVSISDVLLFDPTSLFSASMYGLTKNTFGEKTDALCVVFSHALDKTTISEKSFRLTDQNGNIVIIKDIDILGDRTVKLYIDTPAKEGRYHLYFADTIKNIGGMPLNNVNSENNEDGWADKITLKADYTAPYVTNVSPEYDFAGTLDTFSISFSEAIDGTSLNGKVSMIGPDGRVIAATLKTVANGTAYFTVAPQTAYGEYTIQISADFTDWTGHKLDQNRNGIGGEESDVFEHSFQITNVDLKVADVVLNKNTLAPGEKVTINWNTFNNGGYALAGSWTDGIYLSTDTRWDINDIKLGELVHNGGLAKDQQLANTLDVSLAGVTAGNYYILVRSDIYMQEKGDKESALAVQNLQAVGITVALSDLTVDTPVTGSISKSGEYCVYKLTQNVNEALELVLDSNINNTNMEIYVGNGYIPTREKYDSKVQRLTDGKLVLNASDTERDLYIMVYNKSTGSAFDYTLTAQSIPMSITGITGTVQGNRTGSIFELTGVDFAPDMVVTLTDANGKSVNADKVTFIDNTKVKVEFAAGTLVAGDYTISASYNGETASFDENVTIVQQSGANFNVKFTAPDYVGWKSLTTLYVEYSNTGFDSMDAPLIIVHPHLTDGREGAFLTLDESILTSGFWTSTKPAGFEYSVQMLANGNSPGFLEADSSGNSVYKIPVYYASWQTPWPTITIAIDWGVSYIDSANTSVLDWNEFLADSGKTGKEAELLATNLAASVGTTWGDYVKMLNRNMRYLYENNISTDKVTVADLFNMEYRWASGDITYTPELSANTDNELSCGEKSLDLTRNYYSNFDSRLQVSSFGNGWTCSWDMYLEIAENGDLTFVDGEQKRLFQPNYSEGYNTVANDGSVMKKLNDGTFKLIESDGAYRIFDGNGLLQRMTTADGEEIVFEYADGKLCRIVSGYETRTITRNDSGLITAIVDQYGNTYNYSYDSNGNLITVTDDAGNVTAYTYAAEQLNALSSITSGEEVSNFVYDATGRLTQWTVDGHTYKYDYGTTGMVSVSLDGTLVGTNYYGVDGELVKTIAPDQLTRGNIVYGTLTDSNGNTLAGITVNAITDDKIYTAVTDANGIYTFTGIAADCVTFVVQDAQYKSAQKIESLSGIDITSLSVEKAVNSVSGTYNYADDALAEACVILTHIATGESTIVRGYAGKFAAYDLAAGEYSMQITAGNSATYYDAFTITEDSSYQSLGNYDLKVGGNFSIKITSSASLEESIVYLYDTNGTLINTSLVPANGVMQMENVQAGTYTVEVLSSFNASLKAVETFVVNPLETTEAEITLSTGTAVSGYLFNGTGRAMEGITVVLSNDSNYFYAITDTRGFYRIDHISSGDYTVSLSGVPESIGTLSVAGEESITLNLETEYIASISGHLKNNANENIDGWVNIYNDGQWLDSIYTKDGFYCFNLKQEGNYSVTAVLEDAILTPETEKITINGNKNISIDFSQGSYALSVTSTGLNDEKGNFVLVKLDSQGNSVGSWSQYESNGSLNFDNLSAGKYQLIGGSGNKWVECTFDLEGSKNLVLNFEQQNELAVQFASLESEISLQLYNAQKELVDYLYITEGTAVNFYALPAGEYILSAFGDEIAALQTITIGNGVNSVELALNDQLVQHTGTVTVDGIASEAASVYIYNGDGICIGSGITDESGRYSINTGISEQYSISVWKAGVSNYTSPLFDVLNGDMQISLQSSVLSSTEMPSDPFVPKPEGFYEDWIIKPIANFLADFLLSDRKETYQMAHTEVADYLNLNVCCSDMCDACSNNFDLYAQKTISVVGLYDELNGNYELCKKYLEDAVAGVFDLSTSLLGVILKNSNAIGLCLNVLSVVQGLSSLGDLLSALTGLKEKVVAGCKVFSSGTKLTVQWLQNYMESLRTELQRLLDMNKKATDETIEWISYYSAAQKNGITTASGGLSVKDHLLYNEVEFIHHRMEAESIQRTHGAKYESFAKLRNALKILGPLMDALAVIMGFIDSFKAISSYNKESAEFTENVSEFTQLVDEVIELYQKESTCDNKCCKDDGDDNPPPDGGNGKPVPGGSNVSYSVDPNDKTVMEGFGEQGYIKGHETLNYKVEFENDPEFATAPARWIRVFDTLAPEYDLDTFVINSICLAGNYITVGDGRDSYNQLHEITVASGEKVLVQIAINLDRETRKIFAEFTAIDPETGWMEQDVTTGILFPNDESGCGEGYFTYSIGLNSGVAHGTEITNMAEIYFDFNEVIETPTTVNTIDNVNPVFDGFTAISDGGNQVTFTLNGSDADSGIKGYNISYSTDGENFTFFTTVTGNSWTCEIDLQTEYFFKAQAIDNVGNVSDWSDAITVSQNKFTMPENYKEGKFESITWDGSVTDYVFEISKDNFKTYIAIDISSATNDLFFNDPANFMKNGGFADIAGLPAGTYQWRALNAANRNIEASGTLTGTASGADAFVSEVNGKQDIFFAQTCGKWESGYAAQHNGNLVNNWSGTQEQVTLTGKNKIEDIFVGSNDNNILILTDDTNGDALFLDDIYTNGVTQSRISGIDKIIAGAGDDVIDFTSSRYAYVGTAMEVYGGNGNDTIWMASGENTLFGDAGNDRLIGGANNDVIVGGSGDDRMHGGGGEDIFCFGGNFGTDTIEQLADGKVIVWFGDLKSTDVTISYSGKDTILTASTGKITAKNLHLTQGDLRFGATGFEDKFAELSAQGAFSEATSQQTWELHTDTVAPTTPVIQSFVGEPSTKRMILTWNKSSDNEVVVKYEVRYSTSKDMKNAVVVTTETNTADIGNLSESSVYYWQIRAVDGAGNISAWSPVASYGKFQSVIELDSVGDLNISGERVDGISNYIFPTTDAPTASEVVIGDLTGDWDITGTDGVTGIVSDAQTAKLSIDTISGNWSLSSEGSETVRGADVFGETLADASLGEITSENINLYSDGFVNGIEVWAFGNVGGNASLEIDDFSGNATLKSVSDSVHVLRTLSSKTGKAKTEIGTLDGYINVSAGEDAYGIFNSVLGSGKATIDIDTVSGVVVNVGNENSVCMRAGSTEGKASVSIGELSGGVSAGALNGISHVISLDAYAEADVLIDEISGTVLSYGPESFGLYAISQTYASVGIGEISGEINVEGTEAFAIYAVSTTGSGYIYGSNARTPMNITGIVLANGTDKAYAIAGNVDKYISIFGTVIAGNFVTVDGQLTQKGNGVAIFDGYERYAEGSTTEIAMRSAKSDDTILVQCGGQVVGDISLGGGSNALYVANGAYIYGDITGDSLDMNLVISGAIRQLPMIDVISAGSLLDATTNYTITCSNLQNGAYGLIRCQQSTLDFTETKFEITYGDETAELFGDGTEFTFEDNTTISLAMDDNGMLNLNVETSSAPQAMLAYDQYDSALADATAYMTSPDLSETLNDLLDKNDKGMLA